MEEHETKPVSDNKTPKHSIEKNIKTLNEKHISPVKNLTHVAVKYIYFVNVLAKK